MTSSDVELSVVLPAYEEERNLDSLLPSLHEVAQRFGVPYELLVVDSEKPRDGTPAVCKRHRAIYLPRSGGELYGDAIRSGTKAAKGRFVVFMDADGSHNPSFLPKLWEHREHANLVIASRYVPGGHTDNPAVLIFMSLIVNLTFRILLRLPCADVSNSFRLYRGAELRALHLECDHFDIVEEILVKLYFSHRGYRIKEVPFVFEKRKAGRTKRKLLSFALGYLATLARLYRLKHKVASAATKEE